jgi:hypothetical protein
VCFRRFKPRRCLDAKAGLLAGLLAGNRAENALLPCFSPVMGLTG